MPFVQTPPGTPPAEVKTAFAKPKSNGVHSSQTTNGLQSRVSSSTVKDATTDRTKWRLLDERGRQRWMYLKDEEEAKKWPQSDADRYHLGMDSSQPDLSPAKSPLDSVHNALTFFETLQLPPGNWGCEYGGPMFLLPGVVITWYVTNTPIPDEYCMEIRRYLFNRQNKDDGGWGLHIEGQSTVFGTVLNYVTLRLVGADAEDQRMVQARGLLHELGGALHGPHWAKFWLSVLGVCDWEAVNPVPPELWLLPDWMPMAPWRWWVHMRQVFLPMSYIYSQRFSHPLTPLTSSLREEIYTQSYSTIPFAAHRNTISPRDNAHPKTKLLTGTMWCIVNFYNPFRPNRVKKIAEDWVYELIQREDENSDFACLGPVNGPLNTVACFMREGRDAFSVRRHLERLEDFLWVNQEGMLCNGTNGVQTWDTSFLIQAVIEAGIADSPAWRSMLIKALEFLDDQQIREDCRDEVLCYRQKRKGAWAFSTRDQGYTVSDTTSEAAKAVMLLQAIPGFPKLISSERLHDAIDVLLTMQNASGGFASYEPQRGSPVLNEALNAAEVFNNIMVEYDYPECTTAVVTTLTLFTRLHPDYRAKDISNTISRALVYIRNAQRPDGSWYGSWGICFTYATMFALESLASVGETYDTSERVRRACKFLTDRQREDGGWGESYKSCETSTWCEHPDGSQVVQTAWAAIALMEAKFPDMTVVAKALTLIMKRQGAKGQWEQEGIEGVFNKTCMISYPNYKFIFPIKALGMFATRTDNQALL